MDFYNGMVARLDFLRSLCCASIPVSAPAGVSVCACLCVSGGGGFRWLIYVVVIILYSLLKILLVGI